MICLAPRVAGEILRPRRLSGVVVRPLNFTVRVRAQIQAGGVRASLRSQSQDTSFEAAGMRAGGTSN